MLASNRLGHCELRFLVMKKLVLKNSGILGFRTSKGNENNWFFKKSVQFKNGRSEIHQRTGTSKGEFQILTNRQTDRTT